MQTVKRALISVSDKTGLISLATQLVALDIEVLSTGGSSHQLQLAGIPHRLVEEITGVKEMLGGRVKTLHPRIHGGILGDRVQHRDEMQAHDIACIDLVITNFYPFERVLENVSLSLNEVIEEIDIGGPAMVRAAAKNMAWVGVIVDPADYAQLIETLKLNLSLPSDFREYLALKAFQYTARYDVMIAEHLQTRLTHKQDRRFLALEKAFDLRYGENPHQEAFAFRIQHANNGLLSANNHQGKALSFNNLLDAEAAIACVAEFALPAAIIVKHGNPCGVAEKATIEEAFQYAFLADQSSAFGGVLALNQCCTEKVALQLIEHFMEVVIAPAFSKAALAIFAKKPGLRILSMPILQSQSQKTAWEYKFLGDGVLMQEKNTHALTASDLTWVTEHQPSEPAILMDMLFAWRVVKHVKSNAIVIAKNNQTVGIGGGQVSRVDAVQIAIQKAGEKMQGAVFASDAFFPFRDSIDRIAKTGILAIIQPGGSIRDQEVIDACNQHGLGMAFTGIRCFKH